MVRARAIVSALLLACQSTNPCDDAELSAAAQRVRETQAERPWRIGDPDLRAWQVAGDGIVAACPMLPGRSILGSMREVETPDQLGKAIRRTCPAWDTVLLNYQAGHGASWLDASEDVFELCDLGRFDLVDSRRFGLAGRQIDAFVAYDHMLRQRADATVAAELARALAWQGAWVVADLPSAPAGVGGRAGDIGVRVTDVGFEVHSSAGEGTLAEVIAEVEPWLQTRASQRELDPVRVLVVADPEAAIEDVVAVADAMMERGAGTVSVLTDDPRGFVGAVVIRGPTLEWSSRKVDICIDAAQTLATSYVQPWRPVMSPREAVDVDDEQASAVIVPAATPLARVLGVLGAMQSESSLPSLHPESMQIVPQATCAAWLEVAPTRNR